MDAPPENYPILVIQTATPFEPKALHWPVWYRDLAKMEEMLKKKEYDIDAKDKRGWTPLLQAVVNGYEEMVTTLLAYGADIEAQDKNGWSVLDWKSKIGHSEVKRLLKAAQERTERQTTDEKEHQEHALAVKEERQ